MVIIFYTILEVYTKFETASKITIDEYNKTLLRKMHRRVLFKKL